MYVLEFRLSFSLWISLKLSKVCLLPYLGVKLYIRPHCRESKNAEENKKIHKEQKIGAEHSSSRGWEEIEFSPEQN